MKVYITKYVFTSGTFVIDAEIISDELCFIKRNKYHCTEYFRKPNWHETREEAESRFNEMKEQKIKSLKKHIDGIEALQFSVREEQ